MPHTRTPSTALALTLSFALVLGCGGASPPRDAVGHVGRDGREPERIAEREAAGAKDEKVPNGVITVEPSPPRAEAVPALREPAAAPAEVEAAASAPPTAGREEAKRDDLLALDAIAPAPAKMAAKRSSPASVSRFSLRGIGHGGGGYGRGAVGQSTGHGYRAPLQLARPSGALAPAPDAEFNTEGYAHIADNPFRAVADTPLSTFSLDVDTASYANVRRFLLDGQRPPADAVRIEELLNYFRYDDPAPTAGAPFAVRTEVAPAPWNPRHRLVRIGVRAREIAAERVPPRNLVFLVDVSGSMDSPDKLPLLKQGLAMLARSLRPEDHIAIAVYAGASGLALPVTRGDQHGRILAALGALEPGGSTNGAEGIELAYQLAEERFVAGGINRVILATDGDFNVGVTSHGDLVRLIENKRESGVFLTVLGFGTGNVKDETMEALADHGNGNYAYIDSSAEAKKVLVREAGSTLVTIAKDVKLQVEFNPARVARHRLIGYENRVLADRDFNDDKKDAGDVGAGHSVTALYEIELAGAYEEGRPEVDPLKYQSDRGLTGAAGSTELMTVKIRHKAPDGATSRLTSYAVRDGDARLDDASDDFRWATAVAGFGMLLRNSEHKGSASLDLVLRLARSAVGRDAHGDRGEFIELVDRARRLGVGG
jgi:Ca-activated chloride channel family protein